MGLQRSLLQNILVYKRTTNKAHRGFYRIWQHKSVDLNIADDNNYNADNKKETRCYA